MKRIAAALIILTVLCPAALAQTRRRTGSSSKSAAASQKSAQVLRDGATRVADQLKTLTRFIYILGGVAKGIEAADAAARRKEASPAIIEQTEKSKATVRASLQSVREGLDRLELNFRTTPELNRYYMQLAGSAAGAATAESQAAANQFDRAGRTLLDVVNRLTDVLLAMR